MVRGRKFRGCGRHAAARDARCRTAAAAAVSVGRRPNTSRARTKFYATPPPAGAIGTGAIVVMSADGHRGVRYAYIEHPRAQMVKFTPPAYGSSGRAFTMTHDTVQPVEADGTRDDYCRVYCFTRWGSDFMAFANFTLLYFAYLLIF